jgi:sodium/potassium-transporting ATPase subunit alpha
LIECNIKNYFSCHT